MNSVRQAIGNRYGSIKGLLNLYQHDLTWRFADGVTYPLSQQDRGLRLVFVCHGNICRSAVAEAIAKAKTTELDSASFGLEAKDDEPANERMRAVAELNGYALKDHLTTSLAGFERQDNDLYLAMNLDQYHALREKLGPAAKISLLGLWCNRKRAYLHDPYSCSDEYFHVSFAHIEEAVSNLIQQLQARQH